MKRFVSYLYSIYNNQKIHNAGFARIELRTGRNRVDIHLKENGYAGKTGTVYLFIRKQKNIQGISIGNIIFRGNQADFRFEQSEENIGQTPWQIAQMNGILVVVDERPAFLSQWDEQPVDTDNFEVWSAQGKKEPQTSSSEHENESVSEANNKNMGNTKESEQNKQNMADDYKADNNMINHAVKEEVKQEPVKVPEKEQKKEVNDEVKKETKIEPENKLENQKNNQPENKTENKVQDNIADVTGKRPKTMPIIQQEQIKQEDAAERSGNIQTAELRAQPVNSWIQTWKNMLQIYPVLNQFTDKNNVLCIRIEIKDVRLLPEKYWSMVNNSFLLHGFFNYRYLVFGRIDQNWFIGVPGVYQKQEHVMASVFGFPDFLPQKEKNERGEQPGYWYRILDIQV